MTEIKTVPTHVAIICDGNRRWAKQHGLEAAAGHQQAAEAVFEPLVDEALRLGIQVLTFWVFSTENWRRPQYEVDALLHLLRAQLKSFAHKLGEKDVRLRIIGDITKFPHDIQDQLHEAVEKTKSSDRLTVIFALNYGGRDELSRAVLRIYRKVATGEMTLDQITVDSIEANLDTNGIPDPDLIIRTGGEQRLSGFLPWQSVYSELLFTETYFPDLSPAKFCEIIAVYGDRQRRFGR